MNIITSVERVGTGIFSNEPVSTDETSFVYKNSKNEYRLVENGERLTRMELRAHSFTTRYTFNRSPYTYRYENVFPSKEQNNAFNVTIQFSIVVENPILLVEHKVTDIKQYLDNDMPFYIMSICQDSSIEDITSVQQAIKLLDEQSSLGIDLKTQGLKITQLKSMVVLETKDNEPKKEALYREANEDDHVLLNNGTGNKQYDVFISYSDKDRKHVFAICNKLESKGIRCWYAYRDIQGGKKWSRAIVEAIKVSRVFLLVFSSNSNSSDEVEKEVGLGLKYCDAIIPFRIEDIELSDSLEYHLNNVHWIDALTEPREQKIEALTERILNTIPERKKEIEESLSRKRAKSESSTQKDLESSDTEEPVTHHNGMNKSSQYDVFISYASNDRSMAHEVRYYLEKNRIKCFIAPDDLPIDSNYAEAVATKIEKAKVVIVLLSSQSTHSQYIKNEISLAVRENAPIIPIRLEDVTISGELQFYLHNYQWLDAFEKTTKEVNELLVESVKNLLKR